jgi:hypothetical protein
VFGDEFPQRVAVLGVGQNAFHDHVVSGVQGHSSHPGDESGRDRAHPSAAVFAQHLTTDLVEFDQRAPAAEAAVNGTELGDGGAVAGRWCQVGTAARRS